MATDSSSHFTKTGGLIFRLSDDQWFPFCTCSNTCEILSGGGPVPGTRSEGEARTEGIRDWAVENVLPDQVGSSIGLSRSM